MQISTELFKGWSLGHRLALTKAKEDEIKKGENYLMAAPHLAAQIVILMNVVSEINKQRAAPSYFVVPALTNIVSLIAIPATLFSVSVRGGHYEKYATDLNTSIFGQYVSLPNKLGSHTIKSFCFFSERGNRVIRLALIVGSVAIMAMGNIPYGASSLAAIAYETADSSGYVPFRIALFMEQYMPTISLVGILLGGSVVTRAFAIVSLASTVSCLATLTIQQKMDRIAVKIMNFLFPSINTSTGIPIDEFDAPIIEKRNMSFDEIVRILNLGVYREENTPSILDSNLKSEKSKVEGGFKLIPAHCSKFAYPSDFFCENNNWSEFRALFNQIDWESKPALVVSKLIDDDKFFEVLSKKFPEVGVDIIKANMRHYIELMAEMNNKTVAKFAADWAREQMDIFVDVIDGKRPLKGTKEELSDAKENYAKILAHLKTLDCGIELEDNLLKIAIEGGDYCGKALKFVSNEIFQAILQGKMSDKVDHNTLYELQIKQKLQNIRGDAIDTAYNNFVKSIQKIFKSLANITQDKHFYESIRSYISLGIYPLTNNERNQLHFTDTFQLNIQPALIELRSQILELYQNKLDEGFSEITDINFYIYLAHTINSNSTLSEKQKEDLTEIITFQNNGQWSKDEAKQRLQNLILVQLGILQPVIEP